MIDIYCDSIIRVCKTFIDSKGTKTFVESEDIPARIASYQKLIINSKGQEVFGDMTIKFAREATINYSDYIRILAFKGVSYEMPDKKFVIHKITRPNLLGSEFWVKVWI
jgi:hypothetical protein